MLIKDDFLTNLAMKKYQNYIKILITKERSDLAHFAVDALQEQKIVIVRLN